MHLLYTDETNRDPEQTDYFVYGGVSIDGSHSEALSFDIAKVRHDHGYRPEDLLKFNVAERPAHVSKEAHRDVKRAVMQVAAHHGVRLFASMVLHALATSPDEARRFEINRVCFHFDCYLNRVKDTGLVLIDTFNDPQLPNLLREKFSIGLKNMPYSKSLRMKNILGYHLASIGSSHFCSLIDIVLGAMRFAINNRNSNTRERVVSELMAQLSPLCYREGSDKVSELSLFFSPKSIKSPKFHTDYENLQKFFGRHGMTSGQTILYTPTY